MNSTLRICLLTLLIAGAALAPAGSDKACAAKGNQCTNAGLEPGDRNARGRRGRRNVVTVTAEGNLFVGAQPAQLSSLSQLNAPTVYVKADSRVPYQKVLSVLDALRGHSVVLLTSAPSAGQSSQITWPYGVKVMLGGQ